MIYLAPLTVAPGAGHEGSGQSYLGSDASGRIS